MWIQSQNWQILIFGNSFWVQKMLFGTFEMCKTAELGERRRHFDVKLLDFYDEFEVFIVWAFQLNLLDFLEMIGSDENWRRWFGFSCQFSKTNQTLSWERFLWCPKCITKLIGFKIVLGFSKNNSKIFNHPRWRRVFLRQEKWSKL